MLITGTAGTGKSYLISGLQQNLKHKLKTSATTGIAAYQINGETIHSLAQLPIKMKQLKPLTNRPLKDLQDKLLGVDSIIIDEISMCSQKDFEWIDKRLKQAADSTKPFGGFNIICVGDFAQLPPVMAAPIYRKYNPRKPSSYDGEQLYRLFTTVIHLDEVKRQEGGLKKNNRVC